MGGRGLWASALLPVGVLVAVGSRTSSVGDAGGAAGLTTGVLTGLLLIVGCATVVVGGVLANAGTATGVGCGRAASVGISCFAAAGALRACAAAPAPSTLLSES